MGKLLDGIRARVKEAKACGYLSPDAVEVDRIINFVEATALPKYSLPELTAFCEERPTEPSEKGIHILGGALALRKHIHQHPRLAAPLFCRIQYEIQDAEGRTLEIIPRVLADKAWRRCLDTVTTRKGTVVRVRPRPEWIAVFVVDKNIYAEIKGDFLARSKLSQYCAH